MNGAYKLCIENHIDSEENGYMHKIIKIYAEFIYRSKNKVDILDCAGDTHTELDVVTKAFGYIIEGLNPGFEIYQKWGESFCPLVKVMTTSRAENVTCAFYQFLSRHRGVGICFGSNPP